jgi:O-6-methylguanine DNA methyltransferase
MKMSFREEVYVAVRKIPSGCVATYGEIALMVGRPGAARAVGNVLHANPYEWGSSDVPREFWVPCHRVVGSNGSLTGYGGGIMRKKALLELEGVTQD